MAELHVDSISKWFGTNQLLLDIFISCKPGELIGLLGRNGCGKSTLLKIIFGSLKAETKFISANGTVLQTLGDAKNRIAYLPQNNFLPSHLPIKKIVALFGSPKSLLDNLHVKPFLNIKSAELSGGERRIIETLLIVNSKADYVLIDEPFNGVEPLFKDEIMNAIQEQLTEKGFIVTDHDYRNIISISTKMLLLQNGGIREIKTLDDLVRNNYLPDS
jgi:ABC-type multidrug transport system ATPase subunit